MSPCPHCRASKDPVEVAGHRLHTFSDRWIPCIGNDQPAKIHAFAKAILWIQLVVPFHHLQHLFHLFRSRF